MLWQHLHDTFDALKWAIAGLLGASVISRIHRDEFTGRWDFWVFVASGALSAHYLTGIVAHYAGVTEPNVGAVAFLVGAFGGSVFQAVVRALRAADLWSLIKYRLGGPK